MGTLELPAGWLRITTVDAHAAGEPLRVITGGYRELRRHEFLIDPTDPLKEGFNLR
jgi:proline racemase